MALSPSLTMPSLIALVVILFASRVPLTPSPMVTATDLTTGKVILCRPAAEVTLAFTHSMYGGDVRETFVPLRDGRLRRVEMTTANAAAAEYYAYDTPVIRIGDRFRVAVPPATYDEIIIRVDHIGRHRLRIGSQEIDLLSAAGDGHRVRLAATRATVVDVIRCQLDAATGISPVQEYDD